MTRDRDLESGTGTPSGSREPYSGPSDGRTTAKRLHDVDLTDRGESPEDHQRDRDSKGVAGGYDDSVARRRHEDVDRSGIARGD